MVDVHQVKYCSACGAPLATRGQYCPDCGRKTARTYYDILEISDNATSDKIRSAYRQLAMKWHPDKNQGSKEAEEKFKEIARAYEILSSPLTRAEYDAQLTAGIESDVSGYDVEFATADQMFVEEMFAMAAELTMRNVRWQEIGKTLQERGCPDHVANMIAFQMETYRKTAVRSAAIKSMFWAIFWLTIGGIVTGVTYLAAGTSPTGGVYIVTWGLFLFGGWHLLKAVYFFVTGNAPSDSK